jgi:hypothetical protein
LEQALSMKNLPDPAARRRENLHESAVQWVKPLPDAADPFERTEEQVCRWKAVKRRKREVEKSWFLT